MRLEHFHFDFLRMAEKLGQLPRGFSDGVIKAVDDRDALLLACKAARDYCPMDGANDPNWGWKQKVCDAIKKAEVPA